MHTEYLFVYGTLLLSGNEFAIYLQKNSAFYKKGKFRGKLYNVGEYPGAIEITEGDLYVHGIIVKLNNATVILKHIDHYEGFRAGQTKPYLFVRNLIEAETNNGIVKCWVYLYNHSVNDLYLIKSGDYLKHKNPFRL
jgi:gamma-glutamylcyclotransferase (GGCT)/AIG2-like uncharacterized protein YtfP